MLSTTQKNILEESKRLLPNIEINTGRALQPLLVGFRGKKGKAIAAVYPESVTDVYKLISLYRQMNVGYLLQGANTALKGQGTPNGEERDVVIIKTLKLKKIKILDIPQQQEYKILLVQPGVALKDAEIELNKINFSLPHKTGSHDLGNTFGASCANACGGVEVNNRDGRPSLTHTGNMGVVAISSEGAIYNGFIRSSAMTSGEDLLQRIDNNEITIDDIELPCLNEIDEFLKKLFFEKSYPIRNHRGDLIFPGDGGEGSQAVVYQMYLVHKKPEITQTYVLLFHAKDKKEQFYKEVLFAEGPDHPNSLPILCESMNALIVNEIVNNGVCFIMAALLASSYRWVPKHITQLMRLRNALIRFAPTLYINLESWIGRYFSRFLIPPKIRNTSYEELVIVQVADYQQGQTNIVHFTEKLNHFYDKNTEIMQIIKIKPHSFNERMIIQMRTISAATTLSLSLKEKATLFPFDDALMPGTMTHEYTTLLRQRIEKNLAVKLSGPFLYGHDLKQISHNEWLVFGALTEEQEKEIYRIQLQTVKEVGGFAHAEHGVGDHADTDLDDNELIKLVAHRLLNDVAGLANPGGGAERAFRKACKNPQLFKEGVAMAAAVLKQESDKGTLWSWEGKTDPLLINKLQQNISAFSKTTA
ncbi:FAD-binding protein [Legionella fallonii]|nr:FAD-binding protein [Legionella fallonii]